jgi:hypothetical protein
VVVVDSAFVASQNPNSAVPNVIGCPTTVPPWQPTGTFELIDSTSNPIIASSPAQVDLHQLGVGFGGHTWFTHTGNSGSQEVTAMWHPDVTGTYMVSAFVPAVGGTARQADYKVHATAGTGQQQADIDRYVDQNVVYDQWVSLGFFTFNSGDTITLTSDSVADYSSGLDLALGPIALTPVQLFSSLAAVGDSYSSGEGAADANGNIQPWDPGTDAYDLNGAVGPGWSGVTDWNMCHRSPQAYARLYAQASSRYGGGPVMFPACSGAVTHNIDGHSTGIAGAQYHAGLQIDNLPPPAYVKRIMVTVGGNDMGFGDAARQCVQDAVFDQTLAPVSWMKQCQNDFPKDANGRDRFDRAIQALGPILPKLYEELAAHSSGDVVVSTYPWILPTWLANGTSSGSCMLYPVTPPDVQWLLNKQAELNQMILSSVQQARAAGANVVSNDEATTDASGNHTGSFAGHELCTADPWFNSVDKYNLLNNYSETKWALHPSLKGQSQWAADLAARS